MFTKNNPGFININLYVFVVLTLIGAGSGSQVYAGNIVYPWRAASTIVEDGTDFDILYNNINATVIDSVILEGPFNRVILRIDSVNIGWFEFDTYTHKTTNNRIWVHVPESSPEEMYDLVVKSGGETHVSLQSVKVVHEFDTRHNFIHIQTFMFQDLELNLTLDYDKSNDGSAAYNKATINNKLPVDLPGCKIRFIMKKGNYQVSDGIISQIIETGNFSVVDVRMDVGPEKKEIIEIAQK